MVCGWYLVVVVVVVVVLVVVVVMVMVVVGCVWFLVAGRCRRQYRNSLRRRRRKCRHRRQLPAQPAPGIQHQR